MSQSTLLIRPPADQHANPAPAAPRRAAAAASATSPFAALMAGQEEKRGRGKKAPAPAERPREAVNTLQLRNPVLAGRSPAILRASRFFPKPRRICGIRRLWTA